MILMDSNDWLFLGSIVNHYIISDNFYKEFLKCIYDLWLLILIENLVPLKGWVTGYVFFFLKARIRDIISKSI